MALCLILAMMPIPVTVSFLGHTPRITYEWPTSKASFLGQFYGSVLEMIRFQAVNRAWRLKGERCGITGVWLQLLGT